jgi:hypothetical protein
MKIDFTKKIPDELYIDNFSSNKTLNLTYEGDKTYYILVDKLSGDLSGYLEEPDVAYNKDVYELIIVNPKDDPDVAYYAEHRSDPYDRKFVTETLVDGSNYESISNPTLYDYYNLRYDFENKKWVFVLIIRNPKNMMHDLSDRYRAYVKENKDKAKTAADKKLVSDYIKQLDDFETTGKGAIPSWKLTEFSLSDVPKPSLELITLFNVLPA